MQNAEYLSDTKFDPEDLKANPLNYSSYRRAFDSIARQLLFGDSIPNTVEVSIFGKRKPSALDFCLTGHDRIPIFPGLKPGKSASIFHTRDLDIACLTILNRSVLPNDALYTVLANQLAAIQFQAIYAPTRHHPLHVRLVPAEYDTNGDIPKS